MQFKITGNTFPIFITWNCKQTIKMIKHNLTEIIFNISDRRDVEFICFACLLNICTKHKHGIHLKLSYTAYCVSEIDF